MFGFIVAGSFAVLVLSSPGRAKDKRPEAPTITVTGNGSVSRPADIAQLRFEFIQTGEPAAEAALQASLNERAEPALEFARQVAGNNGKVTASTTRRTIRVRDENDEKKTLERCQIVTALQITLTGETDLEDRINQLYNTNKIRPDKNSEPVLGLSEEKLAPAKAEALQKAAADGVNQVAALANALVPAGERPRLRSANGQANVPSPRYEYAGAYRSAADGASSASQAVFAIGEVVIDATVTFVFDVVDRLKRGAP